MIAAYLALDKKKKASDTDEIDQLVRSKSTSLAKTKLAARWYRSNYEEAGKFRQVRLIVASLSEYRNFDRKKAEKHLLSDFSGKEKMIRQADKKDEDLYQTYQKKLKDASSQATVYPDNIRHACLECEKRLCQQYVLTQKHREEKIFVIVSYEDNVKKYEFTLNGLRNDQHKYAREEACELVNQKSRMLRRLEALNDWLADRVPPDRKDIVLRYSVKSRQACENFDFRKKFEKYVKDNIDDLSEMVRSCRKVDATFKVYSDQVSKASRMKTRYPEHLKNDCLDYEKAAFMRQVKHNNFRPPAVILKVSYVSPGGNASDRNRLGFSYEDLVRTIRKINTSDPVKEAHKRERSKMSTKLRYQVLKRDNYHCVICGRGREDGVKLHVDHIIPVSKGGKTELSNLRTLCDECNLGKSDDYDENYDYAR